MASYTKIEFRGRTWVKAQFKLVGNYVHVQVEGPAHNRPYGAAFDLELDQDARAAVKAALESIRGSNISGPWLTNLKSMASNSAAYTRCFLRPDELAIPAPEELNRSWGVLLKLQLSEENKNWVTSGVEEGE